jgi:pyruvate kinase
MTKKKDRNQSAGTEQISSYSRLGSTEIESILKELMAIWTDMIADGATSKAHLDVVHDNYRDSAWNLLHYLALRRHDLRPLQFRLAELGLSSLGRAESHVMATIEAVLEVLHRLAQRPWLPPVQDVTVVDFARGKSLLMKHTEALLGPADPGRRVRIMVTMPSEAATEYLLVRNILEQGANCIRINCAHDDAAAWAQMIDNLRRAERELGRSCRVVMDLAGPKLRTGPIEQGAAVVHIRPQRDIYGRISAPARVWLQAGSSDLVPPDPADACLPVPKAWLARLRAGDRVKFTDARGEKREFHIVKALDDGCWAETNKATYIVPGTVLRHVPESAKKAKREALVGELPLKDSFLFLHHNDLLIVTKNLKPGRPARLDNLGQPLTPARIGCTIPEVLDQVRAGESIWFDDGKIGGVIEKVEGGQIVVRITQTPLDGGKLRADKGINLPDSVLQLGALTDKDIEDLSFVARHADVVELSFANCVGDVELLQQHLERLGARSVGIVLKIETRTGFENLPNMLLATMRWPSCGVMIARGDLAVECGFERLAEVQEEILWVCEAAHIPVIWATQVLESLAKSGIPSRAEITDAAMGNRAEAVMLNKGSHVLSAVRVLDSILRRMHAHQEKKCAMLRELQLVQVLPAEPGPTT